MWFFGIENPLMFCGDECNGLSFTEHDLYFVKETIMQFTGLLDKNGKEIYEGDIIKADWHWEEPKQVSLNFDWIYDFQEYGLDGDNLEIIGNIYENPELFNP